MLSIKPLVGRAGIEPATRSRRFYRPLPTPIGEPTYDLFLLLKDEQDLAVQTGLEPVNHTLERRAARPLRFCTMNAVQVEKAVVHTQDLNL